MDNRPWQRHYDYNVPLTIRYPRIPAHYFLNIPAGSFPNKTATNFFGTELTFWDLRQQVLRMAHALGEMGAKKGDRIGVHLPNCPQYIIAFCKEKLAAYKAPKMVEFRSELPKSAVGKILRKVLRDEEAAKRDS